MSINNVINEKRKALLAYKEKILEEIKYFETSIDDFRANHKINSYEDYSESSDSEDDFPHAVDNGPSIPQLKLQQATMMTCLQATQELTSLMVLQSEVNVLVEEPKLEREQPVTEAGTWREVTAECRIDLVPFTITFFMHTPNRKFAPPSYRSLRVVPVKNSHEIELSNSVLHSVKLPSDAIKVLNSFAAGYRSRRTTLARLANKYNNALFMEPHTEGGFVMKCADLLEVSWRLENKWSPVARFHHRMKFDLDYMDEAHIKIITQAHKQLLDPAIQTDERTLLLAQIINTCLEVRGPIDPESDLESKTTERDTDIEKRDSETEKRDSEVMAPPKSLPKKVKQKSSIPNPAQKRNMDDEDADGGAKKMKNDVPRDVSKKSVANVETNAKKSKMNDVLTEGGKKRKMNDGNDKIVNKVASSTNVKETGNVEDRDSNINPKNKHTKDSVNTGQDKTNVKAKSVTTKEAGSPEDKDGKIKPNKMKDAGKTDNKGGNTKSKNVKENGKAEDKSSNTKSKTKIVKDTGNTEDTDGNTKPKVLNVKEPDNTGQGKSNIKSKNKIIKESNKIEIVKNSNTKPKNMITKEAGNSEENVNEDNNAKTKITEKKKSKIVNKARSKENIDVKKVSAKNDERPQSKSTEKISNVANTKNIENNPIKTANKPKTTDATKSKEKNVANAQNDDQPIKKTPDNITKNKDKLPDMTNKGSKITVQNKQTVNLHVKTDHSVKKVMLEKNANNVKNKDKISSISNKFSEKNIKDDDTPNMKDIVPKRVISSNLVTKKTKVTTNIKKLTISPIKTIRNITHKISSHRNSLKAQNPRKTLKSGHTKVFTTGNTEKENGGMSKIPQKKLSSISDSSSKKNLLRISPRKLPSKFKSSSQENTFKQKITKTTNIPRLLKKAAPKTTQ